MQKSSDRMEKLAAGQAGEPSRTAALISVFRGRDRSVRVQHSPDGEAWTDIGSVRLGEPRLGSDRPGYVRAVGGDDIPDGQKVMVRIMPRDEVPFPAEEPAKRDADGIAQVEAPSLGDNAAGMAPEDNPAEVERQVPSLGGDSGGDEDPGENAGEMEKVAGDDTPGPNAGGMERVGTDAPAAPNN